MVKQIVRDVFFLGQPSEPATKADIQVGKDLQDTLQANRERCVGRSHYWNKRSNTLERCFYKRIK